MTRRKIKKKRLKNHKIKVVIVRRKQKAKRCLLSLVKRRSPLVLRKKIVIAMT